MASQRLHLKDGVPPEHAIDVLRQLIIDGRNLTSAALNPIGLRDAYLQWAENVESQLPYLTSDPRIATMLQTPRYGLIREIRDSNVQAAPWPLVRAEVEQHVAVLGGLREDLEQGIRWARAAAGQLAVLDTNILLEHEAPSDVDWPAVVGQPDVRLVVPIRVVEELDSIKYDRRPERSRKARSAVRLLDAALTMPGELATLREGVTIEVAPRRAERPPDADREVLDTCHELHQLSGRPVTLITADTAMRLRANGEGVQVVTMPDRYRRAKEPQAA